MGVQVHMLITGLFRGAAHISPCSCAPLGVIWRPRVKAMPDLPTIANRGGLPDVELVSVFRAGGHAGSRSPPAWRNCSDGETPRHERQIRNLGLEGDASSRKAFTGKSRKKIAKWAKSASWRACAASRHAGRLMQRTYSGAAAAAIFWSP